MSSWKDLEDKLFEAIRQCCQTKEDEEAARRYFS